MHGTEKQLTGVARLKPADNEGLNFISVSRFDRTIHDNCYNPPAREFRPNHFFMRFSAREGRNEDSTFFLNSSDAFYKYYVCLFDSIFFVYVWNVGRERRLGAV